MGREPKEPRESAAAAPLTETIFVPLSDREVAELGMRLAETRSRTGKIEDEKREVDQRYNAKLKTLEAEQDTIAKQINERQQEIKVAVKEVPDDARQMVCIVRLDNGELLKTRPMTNKEKGETFMRRQPGLFEGKEQLPEDDDEAAAELTEEGGELAAEEPEESDESDESDEEPRSDTERPPPDPNDVIEHKGQQLRRVPRGGHPEAPKGA